MPYDKDKISSFLHFGYLPILNEDVLSQPWARSRAKDHIMKKEAEKELVAHGVQVLKSVFIKILEAGYRSQNIVPLSGGLDSRAILAGLLENVDSRNIRAVTFGSPGTWDFEIGRNVARQAGVNCESIDISSEAWKWEISGLEKVAELTEGIIRVFPAYVNYQIPNQFGTECDYWSGYMGDPLSGSHLLNIDSTTWDQAKLLFSIRNKYCKSLNLTSPEFDFTKFLPAEPFIESKLLCYDEQIDFGIRQLCYVRRIVLPKGYVFRTPFLHADWVDFMLNVPRYYRKDQYQ